MFDYAEAGKGMAGRLSRRFSFGGNLLIWPKYPEILLPYLQNQRFWSCKTTKLDQNWFDFVDTVYFNQESPFDTLFGCLFQVDHRDLDIIQWQIFWFLGPGAWHVWNMMIMSQDIFEGLKVWERKHRQNYVKGWFQQNAICSYLFITLHCFQEELNLVDGWTRLPVRITATMHVAFFSDCKSHSTRSGCFCTWG